MQVPASFANDIMIRRAFGVAGYTVLVWDFALTLCREIRYVWCSKLSAVNLVFLANRYTNIVCQTLFIAQESAIIRAPSYQFCVNFKSFLASFLIISTESIHILVLMRAWAFWGCERSKAVIMATVYVAYLLCVIGLTAWCMKDPQSARMSLLCLQQTFTDTLIDTDYCGHKAYSLKLFAIPVVFRGYKSHIQPRCFVYFIETGRDIIAITFFSKFKLTISSTTLRGVRTVYQDSPKNIISITFTIPLLNVIGQRLILNLRSTVAHSHRHAMDTELLNQEMSRQIRAIVGVGTDIVLSERECSCPLGCECVCEDLGVSTAPWCCEHKQERVQEIEIEMGGMVAIEGVACGDLGI
ncbi:hypothetical protein SERLA73DRAFT_162588 [Serpula lacrymans var. lacrymans S7.3]|uniref:DUF6533 domain-containing protein n=1 Tax=Serpula lacrymans var. lacrymans (strain S7.3) TaxID=936435 RepID=F8Q8L3_SERL3|nr:hypothetical protein SERLA73DRAFT_162588 [Serpula lacrymans var. lacrymans S7.3]